MNWNDIFHEAKAWVFTIAQLLRNHTFAAFPARQTFIASVRVPIFFFEVQDLDKKISNCTTGKVGNIRQHVFFLIWLLLIGDDSLQKKPWKVRFFVIEAIYYFLVSDVSAYYYKKGGFTDR